MSNVKLRVNMILDSKFVRFGTLVDEDHIPPRLRKRKYILRPGEVDYDAQNLRIQEEAANREEAVDVEDISEDNGDEEETKSVSNSLHVANKRIARR